MKSKLEDQVKKGGGDEVANQYSAGKNLKRKEKLK